VTFTPTDTTDYNTATKTATISVSKATPTLTWATPAAITQGTALSSTQLDATSGGVAGTFTYNPASGTVLATGSHTLSVTFTPTDTADYNTPAAKTTTISVVKSSGQFVEGGLGDNPNATPLLASEAVPLVQEADERWAAAGANVAALGNVQIVVANLPGTYLGEWSKAADTIFVDTNAKGWGWFIDPTPGQDSEFPLKVAKTEERATSGPAAGEIDLLTVVMHEMGHLLGYPDLNPQVSPYDLMSADLAVGTRRLPDSVAAQGSSAQAKDAVFAALAQPQGGTTAGQAAGNEPGAWWLLYGEE
jgi:hypothetical protein